MAQTPDYDVTSLEASIAHRKKTIKNLQSVVSMEQTHIANERKLIETICRKKVISEGIVIDAQADEVAAEAIEEQKPEVIIKTSGPPRRFGLGNNGRRWRSGAEQ